MKFTITSITEEGVRGLTDNPIEKPNVYGDFGDEYEYSEAVKKWQEAEANRREYDVSKDGIELEQGDWYIKGQERDTETMIEHHNRIDGDIINNEIVNVILC